MRAWLLVLLIAGCAAPTGDDGPAVPTSCDGAVRETRLFLDAGHRLVETVPPAGSVFSNGFDEAFLTDDMMEWHSAPWPQAIRAIGNMTLEFWVRNDGSPAPVVVGGQPGEGYHWFNQFGTDRGFVADYGREYAALAPAAGSVDHYVQTIAMPPGGLHVERNDTLRLLLTSLVADDDESAGQHILVGGDTPSSIVLEHHCMASLAWQTLQEASTPVRIPFHQGLITGAVPADARLNFADVPFELQPETQRLTIRLEQTGGPNPLKDDMDITVLGGPAPVSIGSPYADEVGTFYAANLAEMMPPGPYTVRIESYSGHGYQGILTISQDVAVLPA